MTCDSKNDGHFEFYLNDSKIRIWDIWSTPIDIGQGCGKIQRRRRKRENIRSKG